MRENTLKFNDAEVNKKKFHASKQPIVLNLVDTNKIGMKSKIEHDDKSFKYFIGYPGDDIIRPLCIKLPLMSVFIKYFNNGGKNMYNTIHFYG